MRVLAEMARAEEETGASPPQTEIAEAVGTSKQNVSTAQRELELRGVIGPARLAPRLTSEGRKLLRKAGK
jgi:DNA-binding MarR family transcriptional regulator